jgi:hypothetical protein
MKRGNYYTSLKIWSKRWLLNPQFCHLYPGYIVYEVDSMSPVIMIKEYLKFNLGAKKVIENKGYCYYAPSLKYSNKGKQ